MPEPKPHTVHVNNLYNILLNTFNIYFLTCNSISDIGSDENSKSSIERCEDDDCTTEDESDQQGVLGGIETPLKFKISIDFESHTIALYDHNENKIAELHDENELLVFKFAYFLSFGGGIARWMIYTKVIFLRERKLL